jgi:transcriptional regulator with XRE-family HTH domain
MKMLLSDMIFTIVEFGKRRGLNISEDEIAHKLNISREQLNIYLNDEKKMPDNFIDILELSYLDLIGNTRIVKIECIDEENEQEEEESNS